MADVYCAIYGNSDYWDGTTHWGIDPSDESWCVNQAARDTIYTAAYTSLSAWESARDGVALATDTEYAIIQGPWASHDTSEIIFQGWTNKPIAINIKTLGTDARSQDGKFSSNSCYVWENDDADSLFYPNEADFVLNFTGVQFQQTYAGSQILKSSQNGTITLDKCFFSVESSSTDKVFTGTGEGVNIKFTNCVMIGDGGELIKGIVATAKIYNCTIYGNSSYDCIEDDGGTWTVKNTAIFNNADDIQDVDTVVFCATDQGAGEGTSGLDISGTWDSTCFTDQGAGDYSIEADSPLKDASDISYFDDNDVPQDDIIGNPRNTGEGETVSIGAFEYAAAGGGFQPAWARNSNVILQAGHL